MAEHTVLVTGTGGFVGGRLVEAIYLSNFGEVRAGIRRWANASRVARFPVQFVPCDIMKPKEIAAAMEGVTAVVHCAYDGSRELIVDGTENMLRAAAEAGVQRFVYLSSAEVYGPDVEGQVDETTPCRPSGAPYGDAKIEAEQLVERFNGEGLATTILRPSIIYGPFSQSWTINLAERIQSGKWARFEGLGDGICNLVYVDDLVRAIFLAIEVDKAVGEAFNIVGPGRPTWNEYFMRMNDSLGLPPLRDVTTSQAARNSAVRDVISNVTGKVVDRFREPLMRIYMRGGVAGKLMKKVKSRLQATPSSRELEGLYSRKADYSTAKATNLLGFQPEIDLDTGLARCRRWLEFHGFLHDG